jgi:integrase/recombinase XerD
MPLSHDEMVKVLTACDGLQIISPVEGKLNAHRLKTLVLLMRYTGMRISDAVMLTTDRLNGKRLFLYTQKNRRACLRRLAGFGFASSRSNSASHRHAVFLERKRQTGNGKRETAVCDWQMKLKKVFDLAGISKAGGNAISHRFRDTFAVELLLAGVPLERVSILLGHGSVRVTEKHYNPWVRSRQEQLEADVASAWKLDPTLDQEIIRTNSVHLAKGPVN